MNIIPKIHRFLPLFFVLIFCTFLIVVNLEKPRILILHSYDLNYTWVKNINEGMNRVLKNKPYSIKWHYMDTKRHPYPDYMARAGRRAKQLVAEFNPDVLIAYDDDAQREVGKYFVNHPEINIVFAGVQGDLANYNYEDGKNVTGIMELPTLQGIKEGFLQLIASQQQINSSSQNEVDINQENESNSSSATPEKVNKPKRIVHLSDKSSYSRFVVREVKNFNWEPLELVESIEYENFEDWQKAIKAADEKGDFRLITNYHTIQRSTTDKSIVPASEVMAWTEQNSQIPAIGAWGFYVEDGGIISVGVSGFEQGEVAAKMAVDIIEKNQKTTEIPIKKNEQFIVYLRDSGLKKYNIKLPMLYEAFARANEHYFP